MAEATPPLSRLELLVLLLAVCLFGVIEFAVAQNNRTQASTDPVEVRALNSIFEKWRISANQDQWNISGEPCSKDAIDPSIDWLNPEHNPFIKCECTYESNTLCHITQLKVCKKDVANVLPDEIYTLTYLTHVKLDQNYLIGSFSPSSGNLTRLQHLVGIINSLSKELPREFGMLSEMTSLDIGSNNFSGPLPSKPSSWTNLQYMDLSFNNINGQIPDALFNLSSLTHMFLSTNKLNGTLPAAKSPTLLTIDVSHNNLTGSMPSWTNERNLQLNLDGNNFIIEGSNNATPDLNATVSNNPLSFTLNSTGGNRTGMIVGIVVGLVVVILLSLLVIFYVLKRRKQLADQHKELIGLDAKPYMFSYAELRTATEDFSSGNKLGEGGFGPVYKGKLSAGREIAVKQLSVASRQGKSQFVAEIATISEVQHRNLVRLYGCCIAGTKKLLVYEYLENKSLDQALFEKSSLKLDWTIRFDICLGVARGLAYLHEESRLRIIHRDVKASNILLDADLVPKISDFGLAKLYDDKKTHISTRVAGTIGYLAPEYAMRGHLTEKTDVFAFGVLALEVVSGRANLDKSLEEDKIYLLEWAWKLHENNKEVELVDSRLSDFNKEKVKRLIGVALLCTQTMLSLRPPMSRVVAMLSGDIEVPQVSSRPVFLTNSRFDDPTTSFMSDVAVQGTNANSLINSSGTTETDYLPKNASKRSLHDLIGDGR